MTHRALWRRLFGRRARVGWLHLVVGGALLMPFYLLAMVVVGPLAGDGSPFASVTTQLLSFAATLPLIAAFGMLAPARPLSVAAIRSLGLLVDVRANGGPAAVRPRGDGLAEGPARTRAARLRASGWFTLHLALGGIISGATLALTPFAGLLLVLPFVPALRDSPYGVPELAGRQWLLALMPGVGILSMLALAAVSAACAELLARSAPVLLGPTPADRVAAAERRAADLAVRNRLARELHDSVGHALSAVTLQAGAARRVLDSGRASDVEFVREALTAIEETTRRTVGELDAVLGVLRRGEDEAAGIAGPSLETLDDLLARSGVQVALSGDGDLAKVPDQVSREAYRIVQEGLSNALRHAGAAPVTLRLSVLDEELEIVMENPLPPEAPAVRPGGGRGLRGVAERSILLGGRTEAGPHHGKWRVVARLPLTGGRLPAARGPGDENAHREDHRDGNGR
ncbi:sensor histidine kinase [Streptomyces candidus]|uniref:histidine kinase n=1 Tax=Streptomyces candidus TaxID=67283 RepID=A0A7X0HN54_9ACTN|nr:sensor histidine kinase [Streptomyces candidus]MBB6439223.1 signal transduction histidine kinase [Streptomyces candidus]GHH55360.1 histidine kinase [Streptomyces candidus]